jgi:RimJ/RimL family protein N-acetyltransferase
MLGSTKRLLLRAPEDRDLVPILTLWTDPVVTEHVGGPRDRDLVIDHFRQYAQDPEAATRKEAEWWWSVILRSSAEFAGLCCLIEKDVEGQAETDLGYFLLPSYWGHGYAAEAAQLVVDYAFSDLQLQSIVAVIDPRNTTSIAVACKLGLHLDRSVPRSDGVTRHLYRLARDEWRQRNTRRLLP